MSSKYDVVVIGGGPAGIGAARSAAEKGASVAVLERQERLGGILPQCIHNGFGSVRYKQDLPGPSYALNILDEIRELSIDVFTNTHVKSLTAERKVQALSSVAGFLDIRAGAVVLAMGCRERTRAQIRLPGSRPAGVYTAGMVQRMVNIEGYMPGKEFVILGSGDIGMIMARRLTIEGAKVKAVLELLPFLTGLRRNYVQCLEDYDIPLYLSTTVKNIIGKDRLTAIETVRVGEDLQAIGASESMIQCDSLLLSVGLIPENELSRMAGVLLDETTGGPVVDEYMATSVPGIYAAGNVVMIHDLVDYVSFDGETAGNNAARFATEEKKVSGEEILVKAGEGVAAVIPQKIHSFDGDILRIKFRSRVHCEEKVEVCLTADTGEVLTFREPYIRPAEMVILQLRQKHFQVLNDSGVSTLTLSLGARNG